MALSLADQGVRVNAVAPGTIATELARTAVLTSDESKARIPSRTPMRRSGEPEEIADVAAWLLSDAASCVTGEIVVADGGDMMLNYTAAVWGRGFTRRAAGRAPARPWPAPRPCRHLPASHRPRPGGRPRCGSG